MLVLVPLSAALRGLVTLLVMPFCCFGPIRILAGKIGTDGRRSHAFEVCRDMFTGGRLQLSERPCSPATLCKPA
jgi:hypothetical protein